MSVNLTSAFHTEYVSGTIQNVLRIFTHLILLTTQCELGEGGCKAYYIYLHFTNDGLGHKAGSIVTAQGHTGSKLWNWELEPRGSGSSP